LGIIGCGVIDPKIAEKLIVCL